MYRLKLYTTYTLDRVKKINSIDTLFNFSIWLCKGLIQVIKLEKNKNKKQEYKLTNNISIIGELSKSIFKNINIGYDSTLLNNTIIADSYVSNNNEKYYTDLINNHRIQIPAIDILKNNPISWKYNVDVNSSAYWSPDLSNNFLSRLHHINYDPLQNNVQYNVNTILELSARGFVVYITKESLELKSYLGSYLYDMMRNKDIINYNLDQRELCSIKTRREVLKTHSLYGKLLQLSEISGLNIYKLPTVSIILATKRPDYIKRIIDMINLQTYPNIEVVIALHGDNFTKSYMIDTSNIKFSTIITSVDSDVSLGGALQKVTDLSHGELITKIDDDDLYDTDHIWDLVLAYQYSSAELVSKVVKYYYFTGKRDFMAGCMGMAEYYSIYAIGSSLLLPKKILDSVGGWPNLNHTEETVLSKNIRKAGGRIYRTHGSGYVYMRYENKNHMHTSSFQNKSIDKMEYIPPASLEELGFSDEFINKFAYSELFI